MKRRPSEARKVLVLGDSTLASLGGHFANAVDRLRASASYASRLEVLNLSAAGMTSADAFAHFAERSARSAWDAVVVYVGNCDACSFGLAKAKAPAWLAGPLTRWRNAARRRASPRAERSEPFRFAVHPLSAARLERCVSPRDYAHFLRAIVARASRRGIQLVLFNPAAKRRFPPCNNTGNFAFYKIVGVDDALPYRGDADALIRALDLHGAGAFLEASALYERILREAAGEERAFIAANNAAAIQFRQGRSDAALRLLESIPEAGNPLHPLVTFNQALVRAARGEEAAARALFASAAETDSGSYRITDVYRAELARIVAERPPGLWYVDVNELLSDRDFLDYCHPSPEGHERLHRELRRCLEEALELRPGGERPVIECAPGNPDRFAGDRRGLFEYLGVLRAPEAPLAAALLERARSQPYGDTLASWDDLRAEPRERARRRILAHPLFGSESFIAASPPSEPVDLGSLPELYFLRHLLVLHRGRHEASFAEVEELLPEPERVASWWPGLGVREASRERLAQIASELDLAAILVRAEQRLRHSLLRGPVAHTRYRTITYWFLRESLIFGSTSHYSMYFDRVSLLDVLDTCLFALELPAGGDALAGRFRSLLRAAAETLRVHRSHLAPVAAQLFRLDPAAQSRYRADLEGVAASTALATSRFASGV